MSPLNSDQSDQNLAQRLRVGYVYLISEDWIEQVLVQDC
jgi:hypothetical protein